MLAGRLGVSEQEVSEARLAAHSYRLLSLDRPRIDGDGEDDGQLADMLGVLDPALASVEDRMVLGTGWAGCPSATGASSRCATTRN